jgi:hypothetical protein
VCTLDLCKKLSDLPFYLRITVKVMEGWRKKWYKDRGSDRSINLEEWRGEAEKSNHSHKESKLEKIEQQQQTLLSSASKEAAPECILLYTPPLTPTPPSPLPLAAASLPFLIYLYVVSTTNKISFSRNHN